MSDLYRKTSLFFQGNDKTGWRGRKSMRFATHYDAVQEIIYHSGMKTGANEDTESPWVWPNIHLNQDSSCELSLSKPGKPQSAHSFLVLAVLYHTFGPSFLSFSEPFLVLAIFLRWADWTCPKYSKYRFFPFCHSTTHVLWYVLLSFNNSLISF